LFENKETGRGFSRIRLIFVDCINCSATIRLIRVFPRSIFFDLDNSQHAFRCDALATKHHFATPGTIQNYKNPLFTGFLSGTDLALTYLRLSRAFLENATKVSENAPLKSIF
jgi:hypothetical protein